MKKRSFILLEILIAFMLLAICAIPLVHQPIWFFNKEIESFEILEKERLADWTFTEIKELFLKNEIKWEKIPKHRETSPSFPLPPAYLQIPGHKPKRIERSFTLYGQGEKLGKQNEEYRMIYVTIQLDKAPYKFRTPMQRIVEKKLETEHTAK